MAIDLVSAPQVLNINLTRETDFIRVLTAVDGDEFPVGADVELVFKNAGGATVATWPATVTPEEAVWNVDKAVVDTLIALTPTSCRLKYIDGTIDLLWAISSTVGIDG